jgi:molybdopterin synthase catalytic subunit
LIRGHFVFVPTPQELQCNRRFKVMANSVSQVLLTDARLEAPKEDVDPSAGAVLDFWGVVRKLEDGREIEGIDYEAHHAMAEHQMKLIADAAAEQFQLKRILLHHRIGFVRAGEASLFVRVSAPHRAAAFDAGKWVVDELKKKVPIWKKPAFGPRCEPHPRSTGTKATARQARSTEAITI